MKRDFYLPKKDLDYLNNLGLDYDLVKPDNYSYGSSNLFVIIYGYKINQDYYLLSGGGDKVDVLIQIPPGYPNSQIDMASFCPDLIKKDKKGIPNIHRMYNVKKRNWQTWSRHRSGNTWDAEIDFIGTHMEYVESFLQKEVGLINKPTESTSKIKSSIITKEKSGTYILQSKREENLNDDVKNNTGAQSKLKINIGKKK